MSKRAYNFKRCISILRWKPLETFLFHNSFQLDPSIFTYIFVKPEWNQNNEPASITGIPSTLISVELAWKPKRDKEEKKKEGPCSQENEMGRKWRRGSKANILPAGAANRQLLGFEHVLPPCCHDEPRLR